MIGAPVRLVQPAHLWVPERAGTYGPEIIDFAEMAGIPTDAEQRADIDVLASYGPGGRWLTLETAIVEGRQNGKTMKVVLPITMADLWLFGADRIVWTAHLMKTSRDAFLEVKRAVERTPELSRRVRRIVEAKSEEAIELMSGATLEFLARTAGGGRGLGGKSLVFDEALFLDADEMASMIPTLSARENPQIRYAASAELARSTQLRRLRKRGRRGGDPSLIWVERCAPGSWADPPCADGRKCRHVAGEAVGCALDDESLWPLAGHTVGKRISYEYVRGERRTMTAVDFGRERMGWHDEPAEVGNWAAIREAPWRACADPAAGPDGSVGFGVEVAWDRSRTTIGAAGTWQGLPCSEVTGDGDQLDCRPGVDWAVPRLVRLARRHGAAVALDPASPAASLIEPLEQAGVIVLQPTAREIAAVCGEISDGVDAGTWRHRGQLVLDGAVQAAVKVTTRDGLFRWSRGGETDISPLYAVTLAAHAVRVSGDAVSIWGRDDVDEVDEQPGDDELLAVLRRSEDSEQWSAIDAVNAWPDETFRRICALDDAERSSGEELDGG